MTHHKSFFPFLHERFLAEFKAHKERLYLAVTQNISFHKARFQHKSPAHLNMKNYPRHKAFLRFQRKVTQASERDLKYQVEVKNWLSEID